MVMTAADRATIRSDFDALSAFVTRAEILEILKVPESTLYEWQRKGTFPKPHRKIGTRAFWLKNRLIDWLMTAGVKS